MNGNLSNFKFFHVTNSIVIIINEKKTSERKNVEIEKYGRK